MSWTPPDHHPGDPVRPLLSSDGWREAMVAIADRHGLSSRGWQAFDTGSDVAFGGEGIVVKLTTPEWLDDFDAERFFLEHLAGRLRVETPEVVASGELEGWPYIVLSRLEGTAVGDVWPKLDDEERVRLAARLGEMVGELHALAPPAPREDWEEFLRARRQGVVEHHAARGVDEVWLARIEPFLEEVALPERPPVLLHTEVLDAHVLVHETSRGWEPCGLLDFVDANVGHPDYEWAALVEFVFRGAPGCLGACLRGYGREDRELDHEGGRRLCAWGLLHEFAHLGRPLRAAGDPEPASFDELVRRVFDLSRP